MKHLFVIALVGFAVGCGHSAESTSSTLAKGTLPVADYKNLVALPDEAVLLKAEAGQLGVCQIRSVPAGPNTQCTGNEYSVFLADSGLYYPSMTKDFPTDFTCTPDALDTTVKAALEFGFCYTNIVDPPQANSSH
jgi:hypothetical protein